MDRTSLAESALDLLVDVCGDLAKLGELTPLQRAAKVEELAPLVRRVLSLVRFEAINFAVAEVATEDGRRRTYADCAEALGMTVYGVNAAVTRYRTWARARAKARAVRRRTPT